jgi:trimeric autotransporter adhesin
MKKIMKSFPVFLQRFFNKISFTVLFLIICSPSLLFPQNITNTLGTNGIFSIKDASNTFLSLNQVNGYFSLNYCLKLPATTSPSVGVIYMGSDRFLHNYGPYNTFLGVGSGNFTMTGWYNTAVGYNSLCNNTSGAQNTAVGFATLLRNTTGIENVAIGQSSLEFNTTGCKNTAIGWGTLYKNVTGLNNTAVGYGSLLNCTVSGNTGLGFYSLYSNTTGINNTALGSESLRGNTTGYDNTAVGYQTLFSNTTGYWNTSLGTQSLFSNTSGYENTAIGYASLYKNVIGTWNIAIGQAALYNNTASSNTAIGFASLMSNTTGSNNTAIGYNNSVFGSIGSYNTIVGSSAYKNGNTGNNNSAFGYQSLYNNSGSNNSAFGYNSLLNNSTGSNNTALGYDAQVPVGSASNQVRIGNTEVTYAGVQVAWTITSDRRWKKDIATVNLGLDFISKLNPVSYTRINDENQKTEYGFIAQDIEEVLNEYKINKSGMITKDYEGRYELRYNDLLAPMVKAIQELKTEKDDEITILKEENNNLKSRLTALEQKSGIQNTQTAGFLSDNINIGFCFLLVFSSIAYATIFIKKYNKNKDI